MAALSRPSLRSSARKDHVPELPATGVENAPRSRPTRRTSKRARDASLDNESNASSKRLKSSPHEAPRGKGKLSKTEPIKIPIRDKQPSRPSKKGAVTQESPSRRSSNINVFNPPPITSEKRSLRSHDGGSRSKSELAMYIPNYEELISIDAKPAEIITSDTVLHITDEPGPSTGLSFSIDSLSLQPPTSKRKKPAPNGYTQAIEWPEETFSVLTDATRINLASVKTAGRTSKKDPLNDDIYLKIHRKLERQEKQLRNIEKERAMHEKSQLERLIDGLRGHDWLRVMGISGITDSEKKAYEPKRDHLIGEVRILLNKFRLWKEEEKRRKTERDAEAEDDDEEEDAEEEENEEEEAEDEDEDDGEEEAEEEEEEAEDVVPDEEQAESEGGISDGDPPDYSDIDASALQLRLEAARASQPYAKFPSTATKRKSPLISQPTSYTQQTITSFFSKPYQRQAAIGNHRRGRSRYAFGQPLPEPEEQPFELPNDVLTEEALAASDRKRRATKRRRGEDEE